MSDAAETLVGIVEKNRTEEVRVRFAVWQGCDFVDLRVFASSMARTARGGRPSAGWPSPSTASPSS